MDVQLSYSTATGTGSTIILLDKWTMTVYLCLLTTTGNHTNATPNRNASVKVSSHTFIYIIITAL